MNKLRCYLYGTFAVAFFPACAAVGKVLPGGEEQAEQLGSTILSHAPALAEQGGFITTLLTGNPELGGAIAALLTGAAGLWTHKKVKEKKAKKNAA